MVWSTPTRRYPRLAIAAMVDPAGMCPGGGSGPAGRRLPCGTQEVPRVPGGSLLSGRVWTSCGTGSAPLGTALRDAAGPGPVPHAVTSRASVPAARLAVMARPGRGVRGIRGIVRPAPDFVDLVMLFIRHTSQSWVHRNPQ